MRIRTISSLAAGAGLALALAAPLTASAHVTLDDDTAEAGSRVLLTFKVPTESATATTTGVTITLPDAPFASVRVVPVPGWTAEVTGEPATAVTFTADDGVGIGADELGLFTLSIGPVPDVDEIAMPVDQGYSDGSVVTWGDTAEGAEHPAPVLYVDAAPPADEGTTGAPGVSAETEAGPDVLARVFGIAGVVVGAIGLTVALVRRRPAAERDAPERSAR